METISNMTKEDLRQMIKDTFVEVIEDIAMEKAIDEGLKTETIDKDKFMNKLKMKIKG